MCEETFHGFHNLGFLSGTDGSEPCCRPFDARRNGIVLSEGAAVLVLEDEEHAVNRGADILAVVLGCGNAFDPEADSTFDRAGQGLKTAIGLALDDARLRPEDVAYVCGCANGTPGLDRMETRVLKEAFGSRAPAYP